MPRCLGIARGPFSHHDFEPGDGVMPHGKVGAGAVRNRGGIQERQSSQHLAHHFLGGEIVPPDLHVHLERIARCSP